MSNLALEVGHVYRVVVNHGDLAHARRTQIQGHRRPESTGTNDQGMTADNSLLTFNPYFVQQDVAGVAQQFVVSHKALYSSFFSSFRSTRVLLTRTG